MLMEIGFMWLRMMFNGFVFVMLNFGIL